MIKGLGVQSAIIVAIGVLAAFSVFAYIALRARAKAKRREGLPGGFWWWLVIGQDGRVSTSKLQVALWSYAVAFAILTILLVDFNLNDDFQLQNEYLLLLGSPAAAAILAKGITSSRANEGIASKPKVEGEARSRGLARRRERRRGTGGNLRPSVLPVHPGGARCLPGGVLDELA